MELLSQHLQNELAPSEAAAAPPGLCSTDSAASISSIRSGDSEAAVLELEALWPLWLGVRVLMLPAEEIRTETNVGRGIEVGIGIETGGG